MDNERRGETCDFGRKTQAEAIRDSLYHHHDGKFGFRIYRVTYGNDKDFAEFLNLLTAYANSELDGDDTGDEIRHLLDWDVQDNEWEWSGASMNEVRE